MPDATERALEAALAAGSCHMGQLAVRSEGNGFALRHRDDDAREDLRMYHGAIEAAGIARFDDEGNYRPLKTAPDLCHGWQLRVDSISELRAVLDHFYPGRLAVLQAHQAGRLQTTPLRETLDRQSGMYRVAARISDEQISAVVSRVCRSDGGCLRKILWRRDASGVPAAGGRGAKAPPTLKNVAATSELPSTGLAPEKFEAGNETLPLLCQEACAVLIGECRNAVKKQGDAPVSAGD